MPRSRLLWTASLVVAAALVRSQCSAQTTQPATEQETLRELPQEQPEQAQQPQEAEQPTTEPTTEQQAPRRRDAFSTNYIWFIMIGAIILLYVWMGHGRRKKETQRKQMLANLKKGDKVTSIGGIIGSVIEAREDEVLVKVDETNNVRMKFARWAIRGVGEEARKEETEGKT